ncbi:MAG: Holliday junction resolvase [Thermoproteus sp.]|nr:Holliday junction resolvase [Thermoproteus sp.]
MSPKTKGAAKERALANYLWERGCAVLRGCSSGGGVRRRFVPDIVALCGGRVLVLELKYRASRVPMRIDGEKLRGLLEFARRSGGRAYVLVKYGRGPWKVVPVDEGAEGVSINGDVYDKALDFEALLLSLFNRQLL